MIFLSPKLARLLLIWGLVSSKIAFMISAISRSGASFELTVTIPWDEVRKVYDQVFTELSAEIEVEGFRKGQAPKQLVESKVDKGKVYGEVVNRILPEAYRKALEEHNLHPIISPQIKISSGEEDKDWQFIIKAAEKPQVELDSYKDAVSQINAKNKIWTPGKGEPDQPKNSNVAGENKGEEEKSKRITEIIDKLLEICRVELPEVMLESEVNRLITQLVEDVRQAGLTFEQYLASSGQSAEKVREKYHKQAESALKLEFILEAVADDLGVKVEPAEIEAIIAKETDQKRQVALKEQSYVLGSIIRREKTISQLLTL